SPTETEQREHPMPLLASHYDQSRFFKAEDLTTEKKLKIKAVTEEEVGVGKDKERKLVVGFTNDPRGLVLNRVNNRTIRGAFGDGCGGGGGKIFVLFPTVGEFGGAMKPALGVRFPAPKGTGHPPEKLVTPPPAPPPPAPAAAAINPAEID